MTSNKDTSIRYLYFILAFLVLLCYPLMAENTVQQPKKYALQILEQYSPHGYAILQAYNQSPNQIEIGSQQIRMSKTDYGIYIHGNTSLRIAGSLNTVVHEICHGYTHRMAMHSADIQNLGKQQAFYSDQGEPLIVSKTAVFRTNLMANQIPTELRSMRYKTYVASSRANLGSQVDGVYGLLDEWNAYYQGTRTAFDLLDYYKEKQPTSSKIWSQYFQDFYGTDYAYVEFKYFILKYLEYAKARYPGMYRDILANSAFRQVYNRVDHDFTELIRSFNGRNQRLFSYLQKQGLTAKQEQDTIWFQEKNSNSRRGIGTFRKQYQLFEKALTVQQLQAIHQELMEPDS